MTTMGTEPPLPPAVVRQQWWFGAAVAGTILVLLLLVYFVTKSGAMRTGPWKGILLPQLSFVPFFVTIAMMKVTRGRMKRAYVASSGRLCTSCVYNLNGLGETGICPECRRPFDIEADRASWKRARVEG